MADGNVKDVDPVVAAPKFRSPQSPVPPDFGGVMFERSRVRISDITDGIYSTALIAEHTGSTCLNNPNLQANGGRACYAYWANADSFVGAKHITTVASDVVFSSANGINGGNNVTSTGLRIGIPGDISSLHEGGANVALCDGSVRFLSDAINATLLKFICIRNDRQEIEVPGE